MPPKEAFQQAEIEIADAEKELEQATQALNATLPPSCKGFYTRICKSAEGELVLPTRPKSQTYNTNSTAQVLTLASVHKMFTKSEHNGQNGTTVHNLFLFFKTICGIIFLQA